MHPEFDCVDELLHDIVILLRPCLRFDIFMEFQLPSDITDDEMRCIYEALEAIVHFGTQCVVNVKKQCRSEDKRKMNFFGLEHSL